MTVNVLDLFSGIGGFALGLRWAGFPDPVAFCECDEFCRRVLAKHWPGVPVFGDVRDIEADIRGNLYYIGREGDIVMPKGAKRNPKYHAAPALYERGLSIEDCANFYGITRQAMHKILARRGVAFRPQQRHGEENHFWRGGPVSGAARAQNLAEKAIAKGLLISQPCEVCGATGLMADGRNLVQAHHDDYRKPLDVRWLCQEHHHEWHKHNRPIGDDEEPANADGLDLICGGFP